MVLKLGMPVASTMHYAHAHADDFDLDARSQWVDKRQKKPALNYLDN